MTKGLTAPIPAQAVTALSTVVKRDRVEAPEDVPTPTPKRTKIEDQDRQVIRKKGGLYGLYVQASVSLNRPPLDFITFETLLPVHVGSGFDIEKYILSICAVEEKLNLTSSKLSTSDKIASLRSALSIINTTLPDMERTSPEQVNQLTTIVGGLFLSTLTSINHCRPTFKDHTSAMKKDLATAEALQDSLHLDAQEKKSMKQVIDSLEQRVERAEALEGLFRE